MNAIRSLRSDDHLDLETSTPKFTWECSTPPEYGIGFARGEAKKRERKSSEPFPVPLLLRFLTQISNFYCEEALRCTPQDTAQHCVYNYASLRLRIIIKRREGEGILRLGVWKCIQKEISYLLSSFRNIIVLLSHVSQFRKLLTNVIQFRGGRVTTYASQSPHSRLPA